MLKKYQLLGMIGLGTLVAAMVLFISWISWLYFTPTAVVEQSAETIIFKHPTSILFLTKLDSSNIYPRDIKHPEKYQYSNWTPTSNDILPVHRLLHDCFNSNTVQALYIIPKKDINAVRWGLWLDRYIFQYSGITVVTKDQIRNHVIYVSAKPVRDLRPTYDGFKDQWVQTYFYNYFIAHNRIGGGSSYFEIKVDLDTGECFDYQDAGVF